MDLKMQSGRQETLEKQVSFAWGSHGCDEAFLDQLIGEATLEGARLEKVMDVRARLLGGSQRELVLSFSRHALKGVALEDRKAGGLYSA